MTKVFKFYVDAAHGWLAVKAGLLKELDLVDKISIHSYFSGQTVYLEEDCDFPLFKTAYETKYGTLNTVTIDHGDRSLVRNKKSYRPLILTDNVSVGGVEKITENDLNSPKSDF